MLVDSHCHLDRLDLAAHGGSLDAALDAARARGVGQFLCIGVSADNAQAVKALAERYADVHCSVGVHPLDLEPGSAPALDWLLGELAHPRVVAIGETGLDYHYEPEAAELQQEAFRLHLEAARITAKPVIVHTREARADTLALLREVALSQAGVLEARADTLALLREAALPQAGVLHCFTEDWEMARSALDLGFYISLSGIVTFRNADALREVARQVPADRLLVETDSPYLAPIPHRGKPNLPEYVRDVAEFLATLRGVSLETLAEQTTANFHRLFPLAR
ncbi:TatD family hydrolase [Pseudomonas aeruginosa]